MEVRGLVADDFDVNVMMVAVGRVERVADDRPEDAGRQVWTFRAGCEVHSRGACGPRPRRRTR